MTVLRILLIAAIVVPRLGFAAPKEELKDWNEIILQDKKAFTAKAPRRFFAKVKVPAGFEPQYFDKKVKIGNSWQFSDIYYQDVGDFEMIGASQECSHARGLRFEGGKSGKVPTSPCSYISVHYIPIEMMENQGSADAYFADYKKSLSSGSNRFFKENGKVNLVWERDFNFPGGVGRDYLYFSTMANEDFGQPLQREVILITKDKNGKITKLLHLAYNEQDWGKRGQVFSSNTEWKNEGDFEKVLSSVSFSP